MLGRPDVQLKDMMLKLLPEVFAQERQREEAFYQARESDYPSPAPTQTLPPTTRAPAWQTRPRDTPLGQDMFVLFLPAEGSEEAGAAAAEATAANAQESSALPALQLPYLKVQRRMQVLHLRRVLVAALGLADELDPEEVDVLCKGEVLTAPRGDHGFGYDPLMFIPELGATVAELDAGTKNRHSHRARSAALLRAMLAEVWHLG